MRFTATSPIVNATTAFLIVMPRRRSSASVSVWVLPRSTLPTSSMTPASCSRRSVRVVLPASTWARIPRLSVRTERHVLHVDGGVGDGRERSAHGCSFGSVAVGAVSGCAAAVGGGVRARRGPEGRNGERRGGHGRGRRGRHAGLAGRRGAGRAGKARQRSVMTPDR